MWGEHDEQRGYLMRNERLDSAIKDAKLFLDMAVHLQRLGNPSGKLAATVKRRSMDLTNSLANLRKSSYQDVPKH